MSEDGAHPGEDRYITRLQHLENVAAEDVANLLGRFKSADEGAITAYAPTNTIIITDTGSSHPPHDAAPRGHRRGAHGRANLGRAHSLCERGRARRAPHSRSSPSARRPVAVVQAAPAARAAKVNRPRPAGRRGARCPAGMAIGHRGRGRGSRRQQRITKILADERTNSLIIIATERAYLRVLEMIRQLDIPLEGEGRIHVHYVQNGDAAEIAGALQELIGGVSAAPAAGAAPGGRAGAAAAAGATPDLFEGAIRVTSYEPTNALVITSSLHDYAALRSVIERLDAPRRQVFIEAVIMELSVSRSNRLGISFHGGVPNFPSDGAVDHRRLRRGGLHRARARDPHGARPGRTRPERPRGPAAHRHLAAVLRRGHQRPRHFSGDANVLSTPHIIAMDNVEAEISVGQNIPLQTSGLPSNLASLAGGLGGLGGATGAAGGLAGLAGGLGGLGGGFGSAPRQDVGTTIRITPHINQSNQIRMEIEEEISERGATEGDLQVVSINKRTAKTEVMVRDQQTVVIGGLMRDSVVTSERKVPILGDIPLIGALFRDTTSSTQKTNLLLFLTPYIIRDPADLRAIYERKMRERQEFLDRYFVFSGDDYEPPIDYSRTRGLLAEMMQNMRDLEVERELAEAAEAAASGTTCRAPPWAIFVREAALGRTWSIDVATSANAPTWASSAPTARRSRPPTWCRPRTPSRVPVAHAFATVHRRSPRTPRRHHAGGPPRGGADQGRGARRAAQGAAARGADRGRRGAGEGAGRRDGHGVPARDRGGQRARRSRGAGAHQLRPSRTGWCPSASATAVQVGVAVSNPLDPTPSTTCARCSAGDIEPSPCRPDGHRRRHQPHLRPPRRGCAVRGEASTATPRSCWTSST